MSTHILVVDDEPDLELLIKQRFRKRIRAGELRFEFAGNGVEALQALEKEKDIDIVMTDINMPKMDGLTLLGNLFDGNANPTLKAIIVSAYGDMENIRTAMNRGAFDFITKPIDFEDLEITINKTIDDLKAVKQALKARDELLAIHRELDIANSIQQSILPRTFPPYPERTDFEIFADMLPAREVGGDFYDLFLIDEDRLGFIIGDVSGKGVPAAIFMAMSRTLLKAIALRGLPPAECLNHANVVLSTESQTAMFVTVFYGILDTSSGEMIYANGGHNPPYILNRVGGVQSLESKGDLVVGMMEEFKYTEHRTRLDVGDCVFLYTDGVPEALDGSDNMYTDERLATVLESLGNSPIDGIVRSVIADVHAYATGSPQSDDITSLAVRYLGRNSNR